MNGARPTVLRILMVSEDIPAANLGGLGKHVVRLGNYLIRQGHTVDLMGWADVEYEPCRREVGFEGRYIPGFTFKGTNWKEHALGAFVPGKRSFRARRIARAILRVAADYDVIHYHGHYPMIGRYIPRGVNFIQTRHDQGSECPIHLRFKRGQICASDNPHDCAECAPNARTGWWREQISAYAVRQYRRHTAASFARHKTVFVSDFLRQAFLRHVPHADSRNMHVVHNFIDSRMLPGARSADPRSVLFVGRIDEAKGVMALLDELEKVGARDLQFDIIGDGPHRASCQERYAAPNVRFHGWRLQAEALTATAEAGRIVVPSILEESCGTTILEGLALGKMVYALKRGGTPELTRYEVRPGQLRLFESMAELAHALVTDDAVLTATTLWPPATFGADIELKADDLLRLYLSTTRASHVGASKLERS